MACRPYSIVGGRLPRASDSGKRTTGPRSAADPTPRSAGRRDMRGGRPELWWLLGVAIPAGILLWRHDARGLPVPGDEPVHDLGAMGRDGVGNTAGVRTGGGTGRARRGRGGTSVTSSRRSPTRRTAPGPAGVARRPQTGTGASRRQVGRRVPQARADARVSVEPAPRDSSERRRGIATAPPRSPRRTGRGGGRGRGAAEPPCFMARALGTRSLTASRGPEPGSRA